MCGLIAAKIHVQFDDTGISSISTRSSSSSTHGQLMMCTLSGTVTGPALDNYLSIYHATQQPMRCRVLGTALQLLHIRGFSFVSAMVHMVFLCLRNGTHGIFFAVQVEGTEG
jgi:hypothetical protein